MISPVAIEGRTIAKTSGESRGAATWRRIATTRIVCLAVAPTHGNGSVIDLQIERGRVRALVTGSSLYDVTIEIRPLAPKRWRAITSRCAGKIDSLIELLQGAISSAVMEVVTRKGEGLFPAPRDILAGLLLPRLGHHVQARGGVLYGVGLASTMSPRCCSRSGVSSPPT